MKRLVLMLCALGLLTAGVVPAFAAEKKITIKIAGMKPEGEPETIGMHKFGEYLEALSGGKYEVKVFPNSMLGKEKKYIADTRKGVIQMCATGTQTSAMHPAMAMLETPMLYDSYDHAHRALVDKGNGTGKVFDLINDGFPERSGLRTLNAFPLGFRHFYTKKPVKSIDDVKGLRMRVPNIPLYTNFAKECGISGQPMPFAEVPGALDQGVIDGGDSPLSDIVALKMYEITPQITLTGHILVIHSLYINEKFYQSLPDQDKEWFNKAAFQAAEDVWKLVEEKDNEGTKTILANKGFITEPTPEFRAYMQEAGKRSWSLFLDPQSSGFVPNAKEIFEAAASYRK